MFRDGRRKIDMVLCYEEENEGVMTEIEARKREQRKVFEENLVKEGLEIELEDKSKAFDEKTYFLKIHIPWRTETRIAEVMNLKLPVKQFITISVKAWVRIFKEILCGLLSNQLYLFTHRTRTIRWTASRTYFKNGGENVANGRTSIRYHRRWSRHFIVLLAEEILRSSSW